MTDEATARTLEPALPEPTPLEREWELEREAKILRAQNGLLNFTLATFPTEYDVGWHHKAMCRALNRFASGELKRLIINVPPRHGKQLADSTPMLTPTGWTTHGQLKPGDWVFSPSGQPVRVQAVSAKTLATYEIVFSNGAVIKCHANHEWTVYDRGGAPGWRTVDTAYMASQKYLSGGRCRFQLPDVAPLDPPLVELPLAPYFLGVWLGGGSAGKPVITHDHRDAAMIQGVVACGYSISNAWVHPATKVVTTSFADNGIGVALRGLGIYDVKDIPVSYRRGSKAQRLELLAGLVDSDGHVDPKGRVRISTTNLGIVDGLVEIVRSLGWSPYVMEAEPALSSSGIQGRLTVYQVGFQPTDPIPTKLERKQLKRFAPQRRIGITLVREISNPEPGHCIQVDSPDGLYLAGRELVPTHNSELVSRRLPAWLLGRNPRAKIIGTSYSDSLASSMNRDVQRIIESEQYRELFPDTRLRGDRLAVGTTAWLKNSGIFEIVNHGGCYRSAGIGGSITGIGGNYILLDDFCKNQEEADSELMRNRTFDWFGSTLYTRLEAGAGLLITATRWHEDDLVGRLLKLAKDDPSADQWEVISFPAMSETHPYHLDPRTPGEALWPARYDKYRLAGIKASIGTRNWSALYQQRPAPQEGMIVNREWWQFYKAVPLSFDSIIQSWDLTFTKSATSDYVVGVVLGRAGANIYLLDMIRDRLSFTSSIAAMKRMCSRWPQAEAKYVEAAANGHALIDMLRSEIPGLIPVKPMGSKVARANAVSPRIESGNVWLPDKALAPWVDDVVEEWTSFPAGAHDDICDSMTHGILKLMAQAPMDYLPLSLTGGTVFPRNP